MKRYNRVSNNLEPLKPSTKVLLLTGSKNPRWALSGIVVRCLPFRQYKVKLNGSGRIVLRNRRFLREYSFHNPPVSQTTLLLFLTLLAKRITEVLIKIQTQLWRKMTTYIHKNTHIPTWRKERRPHECSSKYCHTTIMVLQKAAVTSIIILQEAEHSSETHCELL